jgi:ribosome biogenesis protein BMS1
VTDDDDQEGNGNESDDGAESSDDDEFFKIRGKANVSSSTKSTKVKDEAPKAVLLGEDDSSRQFSEEFDLGVWLEDGDDCLLESLRDKFVTGNWDADGENQEEFDDFEDLETGDKFGPNGEIDSDDDDEDSMEGMTDEQQREHNAQKKSKKKNEFNDEYDQDKEGDAGNQADGKTEGEYIETLKRKKEERLKRNEEEFGKDGEAARLRHEGFRQGLYCRIKIDGIPAEFLDAFNPNMPLVIGGLTPQETDRGLIRCRFKKHRWHKKILKCNDPLIFSVGWRRFQSMPVFSTQDENGRHRYVNTLHFRLFKCTFYF